MSFNFVSLFFLQESKITRRQLIYYLRRIVGDKLLIAVLKCFNANMRNTENKRSSGKLDTQEIY